MTITGEQLKAARELRLVPVCRRKATSRADRERDGA
jgi:hypothetical protein